MSHVRRRCWGKPPRRSAKVATTTMTTPVLATTKIMKSWLLTALIFLDVISTNACASEKVIRQASNNGKNTNNGAAFPRTTCSPSLLAAADIDQNGWLDQFEYQFVLTQLADSFNSNSVNNTGVTTSSNNDTASNNTTKSDVIESIANDNTVNTVQPYCDIVTAYYYGELLQNVWEVLSCLCQQFDAPEDGNSDNAFEDFCCNSTNPQVAVPGTNSHYPEPLYSTKVCQVLDRAVFSECERLHMATDIDHQPTKETTAITLPPETTTTQPPDDQSGDQQNENSNQQPQDIDNTIQNNESLGDAAVNVTGTTSSEIFDTVDSQNADAQSNSLEKQTQTTSIGEEFRQPKTIISIIAFFLFCAFFGFCCFLSNREKKREEMLQQDPAFIPVTEQEKTQTQYQSQTQNENTRTTDQHKMQGEFKDEIETQNSDENNNYNEKFYDTENHNKNQNMHNQFRISNILSGMNLQQEFPMHQRNFTDNQNNQYEQEKEQEQEKHCQKLTCPKLVGEQTQHTYHRQQFNGIVESSFTNNAKLNPTVASHQIEMASFSLDTSVQIFINDDESSSIEDILHRSSHRARQNKNKNNKRVRRSHRHTHDGIQADSFNDNNKSHNSSHCNFHSDDDDESSVWDMLRRSSSYNKRKNLQLVEMPREKEDEVLEEYCLQQRQQAQPEGQEQLQYHHQQHRVETYHDLTKDIASDLIQNDTNGESNGSYTAVAQDFAMLLFDLGTPAATTTIAPIESSVSDIAFNPDDTINTYSNDIAETGTDLHNHFVDNYDFSGLDSTMINHDTTTATITTKDGQLPSSSLDSSLYNQNTATPRESLQQQQQQQGELLSEVYEQQQQQHQENNYISATIQNSEGKEIQDQSNGSNMYIHSKNATLYATTTTCSAVYKQQTQDITENQYHNPSCSSQSAYFESSPKMQFLRKNQLVPGSVISSPKMKRGGQPIFAHDCSLQENCIGHQEPELKPIQNECPIKDLTNLIVVTTAPSTTKNYTAVRTPAKLIDMENGGTSGSNKAQTENQQQYQHQQYQLEGKAKTVVLSTTPDTSPASSSSSLSSDQSLSSLDGDDHSNDTNNDDDFMLQTMVTKARFTSPTLSRQQQQEKQEIKPLTIKVVNLMVRSKKNATTSTGAVEGIMKSNSFTDNETGIVTTSMPASSNAAFTTTSISTDDTASNHHKDAVADDRPLYMIV